MNLVLESYHSYISECGVDLIYASSEVVWLFVERGFVRQYQNRALRTAASLWSDDLSCFAMMTHILAELYGSNRYLGLGYGVLCLCIHI